MSYILHKPKTRAEYTDPAAVELFNYFAEKLGWGETLEARATFEFLMEARAFSKGKTVLDAGAGHQRFKPFFTESNYLTLEHPSGIDMKNMQGFTYDIVAELDTDPFMPAESVDAIYSHSVIEHIARPERFFSNAFDALKPGGRLFISVPFMYPEHEVPYDFQRFTRYGLKSRLEEAGFNIVQMLPASSSVASTTSFVLNAIENDSKVRAIALGPYTLPDGSQVPVIPLLANIFKALNPAFDDAIYETVHAIGYLCIAEKSPAP